MPKYQYKAMNMSGGTIEGIYDAPNQRAVYEMIRQKSFYSLEVKELIERKDINTLGSMGKIGSRDIAIFCSQFSSILKAGVPLIQSLNMLSGQVENKMLQSIIKNMSEEVQKGSSLSQAMSLHSKRFPPILINMIVAGEKSGTLNNSLENMAEYFEKQYKLQKKIKSAMVYPVVVCVITIAVIWILLTKVVPTFINLFESAGATLPAPTRLLIFLSKFFRTNGLFLILGFMALAILVKVYLTGESGRLTFHKALLSFPVVGKMQTKIVSERFARTLATLLTTGMSITDSLEITKNVLGNAYAAKEMSEVIEQVKQGKNLYTSIKSIGIFPLMIENMVMLGEQAGTLESMLIKAADYYEEEVNREVQNLTSLMEPAIIVVLGGIVAFVVVSIVLPMYDMMKIVR